MQNGSFVVIFKNKSRQEVFLVYRTDYPIWSVPGGGIDPGETPLEAAIRESIEETGFKIKITQHLGTYNFLRPNPRSVTLFEGFYQSGTYQPEFKGNIGHWFNTNNLPKDMTSNAKNMIQDALSPIETPFIKSKNQSLSLHSNLHLIIRHPTWTIKFIKLFLKFR